MNDKNESPKIGRTPEVNEARIIEAGKRIESAGKPVTGWSLRTAIGAGNPTRLANVWQEFKKENNEIIVASPVVDEFTSLPPEVEDGLRLMLGEVNAGLEQLIRKSNAIAVRAADSRVKMQYDAAKAAQLNAESGLSEAEAALDQADQKAADLMEENKQQDAVIRDLTGQQEKLKAEYIQLQKQHQNLENKNEKLEIKTSDQANAISALKTELDVSKNEILLKKAEIDRLLIVESRLNDTNKELIKAETELKTQQEQNFKLSNQVTNYQNQKSELEKELRESKNELNTVKIDSEKYKTEATLFKEQTIEQKAKVADLEQKNTHLHEEIEKQAAALGAATAQLASLKNKLQED